MSILTELLPMLIILPIYLQIVQPHAKAENWPTWQIILAMFVLQSLVTRALAIVGLDGRKPLGSKAAPIDGITLVQAESGTIANAVVKQATDLRVGGGRVLVIESWATWCGPCVKAMPHLSTAFRNMRLAEKEVDFVGVTSESKSAEEVAAWLKENFKNGIAYPIALDTAGSVKSNYSSSGIPYAWVVGRDGCIAWEGHPMSGLEAAVDAALAAGPAAAEVEDINKED